MNPIITHDQFLQLKQSSPLVSVIVPTYESALFIEECLRSIKNQSHSSVEIIVIDNYSEDDTRKIAERYGAIVIPSKSIRSKARNIGASLAKGEFILSIDSDMVLGQNVITSCLNETRLGYDAIIIPEVSFGQSYWAKCRALEKVSYFNNNMIEAPRFFAKSSFDNIGGYNPILEAGEDWDLHQRIKQSGCRIGRINEIILHDEDKLTLKNAVMKKYSYGKGFKLYRKMHPREGINRLVYKASLVAKLPLFVRYPYHASGMFLMKYCELVAFLIGMI